MCIVTGAFGGLGLLLVQWLAERGAKQLVLVSRHGPPEHASGVVAKLEAMGHVFQRISLRGELRMGYGAVVLIDGNRVRAGGDPRRGGAGGAVR